MGFFLCALFWVAAALIVIKVYLKLTTGWCRSNVCLVGKTTIITGANTGIGYETAADFAKRGARVILACRNQGRGEDAQRRLIKDTDNPNIIYKNLDLASPQSVREFAEDIIKTEERLDILVNNAGIGSVGAGSSMVKDGVSVLMQTNYFGHFLLTNLLLDLIKKSPNSRIINVSSGAAKMQKGPLDVHKLNEITPPGLKEMQVYARSKLCNILFTIELAKKLKGTSVSTFSLHPGAILTDIFDATPIYIRIFKTLAVWFMKDSQEGAQTNIYCSVEKNIEYLSGHHFEDCRVVKRYKQAQDLDLPSKLWEVTEELVSLKKQE